MHAYIHAYVIQATAEKAAGGPTRAGQLFQSGALAERQLLQHPAGQVGIRWQHTQKSKLNTYIYNYIPTHTYRFMPRRSKSKSGSRNGSNLPTNVPEVSGRSGEVRQLGVVAEVELLQSGARPDLVRQPAQVVRRQRDLLNRCEKGTHTYIHSGQGAR